MPNPRFEIRLHRAAQKEYMDLDHSVVEIVDKALEELEMRADEVGKRLGNKGNNKLVGCKEIKLKAAGIRIVFTITNEYVHVLQVVIILAVESRADDVVFQLAGKKVEEMKKENKRKTRNDSQK